MKIAQAADCRDFVEHKQEEEALKAAQKRKKDIVWGYDASLCPDVYVCHHICLLVQVLPALAAHWFCHAQIETDVTYSFSNFHVSIFLCCRFEAKQRWESKSNMGFMWQAAETVHRLFVLDNFIKVVFFLLKDRSCFFVYFEDFTVAQCEGAEVTHWLRKKPIHIVGERERERGREREREREREKIIEHSN